MVCAVVAVADGMIEEENAEEFGDQYREPEPEDPYREQELPKGFEDGKSNLILRCVFVPVLQTQPIGLFIKLYNVYCWNMVG